MSSLFLDKFIVFFSLSSPVTSPWLAFHKKVDTEMGAMDYKEYETKLSSSTIISWNP